MRTRVGYAGGTRPDPTYAAIGDHTEVFQIDFDPARLSYEDLLGAFWNEHDPTAPVRSTQYKAMVLASGDEQFDAAVRSRDEMASRLGRPITTEVRRLERFYLAEEYHQKYALKGDRLLLGEMLECYPSDDCLRESTAAARLNGYIYGTGSLLQLEREIAQFGLSERGERYLRGLVRGGVRTREP